MEAIDRARQFFAHNGRDIDQARFTYHFGAGSQDDLLAALGRYQNPDGGFGHGLEPDIQAPESNPFATQIALLICAQADVPRAHPLLQKTVEFLERTQDEEGCWRFTEEVYRRELAPWFQGWEWPNLNPSCPLSGLLKELGLGSETLHTRVERLFARLARVEDLTGDEFYAVLPYAGYFMPEWAHPQRELYQSGVLWWLIRQHLADKLADSDHFFAFVRGPDSFVGKHLPEKLLAERLERLESEQAEDGGWPSPYSAHWRGWTTVQNLLVLRAFGQV